MSVKMSSRQVGDVTVVDATGRITLGEGASVFRDVIRDLAAKGLDSGPVQTTPGDDEPDAAAAG